MMKLLLAVRNLLQRWLRTAPKGETLYPPSKYTIEAARKMGVVALPAPRGQVAFYRPTSSEPGRYNSLKEGMVSVEFL